MKINLQIKMTLKIGMSLKMKLASKMKIIITSCAALESNSLLSWRLPNFLSDFIDFKKKTKGFLQIEQDKLNQICVLK